MTAVSVHTRIPDRSLACRPRASCFGLLALVIASSLLAGGCSGNPQAAPETPTTSETPAKPSFAPTPAEPEDIPLPTLAPEAERDDTAGACAVAQYVVEHLSYDVNHGYPATYEQYSLPECKNCQEEISIALKESENGGWTRGRWIEELQLVGSSDTTNPSIKYCRFEGVMGPGSYWDGVSDAITTEARSSFWIGYYMEHRDGRWAIKDLESHVAPAE